jgi:hypothetical protein
MEPLYIRGRKLEAKDLQCILELIETHRDWNRTKLSQHIAQNWEWRKCSGTAQGHGLPRDAPEAGAKRLHSHPIAFSVKAQKKVVGMAL